MTNKKYIYLNALTHNFLLLDIYVIIITVNIHSTKISNKYFFDC